MVLKKRKKFEVFYINKENCMKSSSKNKTKGVYHEGKGKIKETVDRAAISRVSSMP
jgi:hypothetical protein